MALNLYALSLVTEQVVEILLMRPDAALKMTSKCPFIFYKLCFFGHFCLFSHLPERVSTVC